MRKALISLADKNRGLALLELFIADLICIFLMILCLLLILMLASISLTMLLGLMGL